MEAQYFDRNVFYHYRTLAAVNYQHLPNKDRVQQRYHDLFSLLLSLEEHKSLVTNKTAVIGGQDDNQTPCLDRMEEFGSFPISKKPIFAQLQVFLRTHACMLVTLRNSEEVCTTGLHFQYSGPSNQQSQVTGQFLPGRVTKLEILKHFKRVTC